MEALRSESHPAAPRALGRYGTSWINRLTERIEALPGPAWVAYAVIIGVSVSASLLASALEPVLAATGAPAAVYYGTLTWAMLGLIHLLDRTARQAMDELGPLLSLASEERAGLLRELTVIPARPAIAILVVTAVLTPLSYAADPVGANVVGLSPVGLVFRTLAETFTGVFMLAIVYHTVRQLRLIPRIHDAITEVDPFSQGPLFAMASVTSTTAAGLTLLLAPSLFLLPTSSELGFIVLTAVWYGAGVGVALLAFILPLRGIHARLLAAKEELLAGLSRRMRTTLEALNAAVDRADGPAIETYTKAVAGLGAEREVVARLPTWPFSTGALTRFVSAVLLPLALWLVTRFLERLV